MGNTLRIFAPMLVIGVLTLGPLAYYVHRRANPPVAPTPTSDIAQEARDDLTQRNFTPLSASLESLLNDPAYEPVPTQAHTLLLQSAPAFKLTDVDGKEWTLAQQLRDGPVVLVFYYGYHCNHCVSQLFALDKDIDKFRELGVTVVSVSADAPELTRERFKQYGAFKFPVLSDPKNKIAQQYEVYVPNSKPDQEGSLVHGTFVITRQGKIAWAQCGAEPFTEHRTLLHEVARVEGR